MKKKCFHKNGAFFFTTALGLGLWMVSCVGTTRPAEPRWSLAKLSAQEDDFTYVTALSSAVAKKGVRKKRESLRAEAAQNASRLIAETWVKRVLEKSVLPPRTPALGRTREEDRDVLLYTSFFKAASVHVQAVDSRQERYKWPDGKKGMRIRVLFRYPHLLFVKAAEQELQSRLNNIREKGADFSGAQELDIILKNGLLSP